MVVAERRCAIYTRKSSEDGLEQSFNSLDAQYEACAAYVASQRHEGWCLLPQRYDDGGYSGGTLERPALQELLAAVEAGHVDLIVVYKIDRLTRSLMDFARLVERFDRHQVSFVSVTQAFNTTTSMGRLTLNVLLSFAQFEREVTGERIRDKIAASKRKGLWMGGTVPMGYAAEDRRLVVVPEAAAEVVRLFERYRALKSVAALKAELDAQGIVSRIRESRKGRQSGGMPYSRGALYQLLKNRVYRGEIAHKGTWHPGPHEPIVPEALWNAVQAQLELQRTERRLGGRAKEASLLASMVVDDQGQRLTPSHTVKAGKRYRYYLGRQPAPEHREQDGLSKAKNQPHGARAKGGAAVSQTRPRRLCVPAHDLERLVIDAWKALLGSPDLDVQLRVEEPELGRSIRRAAEAKLEAWDQLALPEQRRALLDADVQVRVFQTHVELALAPERLVTSLAGTSPSRPPRQGHNPRSLVRRIDACVIRLYGETRILEQDAQTQSEARRPIERSLLLAIAQGRQWHQQLIAGQVTSIATLARRSNISTAQVLHTLRCAWLAPDLVEKLLDGRARSALTRANVRERFTASWKEQRAQWG